MRTLIALAFATLLLGWSHHAWAKCPDGQVLKKIGNLLTDDGVLSTQGQDVHAIFVDCSATACIAALVNEDTLGAFDSAADVVWEGGAAASGTLFLDLTESPLYFSEGVVFSDDINVDAVMAYSCQPR